MNIKCPRCGGTETAPIMYGMPAFSDELEQTIQNCKIVLGGCCVSEVSPKYHCFGCDKDFGTPPILLSKRGLEQYEDIVTSIRFSDGGYFDGYPEVVMKKSKDTILVDVRPGFSTEGMLHREMPEDEWRKVISKLYEHLYVHEWKKRFVDSDIFDGEQWELEVQLTGGRKRTYCGSNAFPPLWKELKNVFRPYFTEANIQL